MPIYSGSDLLSELYVDGPISEGWVWSGGQWVQVYSSAREFVPMGVNKVGTHVLDQGVRTVVSGWQPRPGYSGTVLDGDQLRIVGSADVKVTAQIDFATAAFGITQHRWIMHNGVAVASESLANYRTRTVTAEIAVGHGDLVWIEAMNNTTNPAYRTIAETTYITVELASA